VADEIIGGYKLQNLMWTGQTSQTWEVVELASHRHFAMKLLLPEHIEDKEHRHYLLHEAMVGKKLAHPNIIRIITVSKSHKNPYFVMEFFPAGSLKLRVMRKQFDFIKERLHNILKKVATGLAYMNANGWVHRDVKPDNILCNSAGEVRIIDFALARRIEKPSLLAKILGRKLKVQGTYSYMAPEQIRGEYLDGRADIYAFGATAYELSTGRPPFSGFSRQDLLAKHIVEKPVAPQARNAELTDQFGAFVLECLAKKRDARPRDFHQVLMKLQGLRIFKNEPVSSGRSDEK
jgi:serine/threonine-protein kinase